MQFSTWSRAFVLLFIGSFTAEGFFECVANSSKPVEGTLLMLLYFCLISILLLNMLIAMMAKSFDNVREAAAMNYVFLFSQTTHTISEQPPAPPP